MSSFIFIAAVILALLVCLFIWRSLNGRVLRGASMTAIQRAWKHAEARESLTLRVVEADKVLDEALRLLGYQGTLGEKLKKSGARFSDIDGLWRAHKLRNALVHELSKEPSKNEVTVAMKSFHRALQELGMKS